MRYWKLTSIVSVVPALSPVAFVQTETESVKKSAFVSNTLNW